MRIVCSTLGLLAIGLSAASCRVNQDDCDLNPELACYRSGTGGGGAGDSSDSGAGAGMNEADACNDGVRNGFESQTDCGLATTCGACNGDACNGGDDCKSGHCVDGVCCSSACDGACEACNLSVPGSCSPLAFGQFDAECNGACGEEGHCACNDGKKNLQETDVDCGGACGKCAKGSACKVNDDCESGYCVDDYCCSSACDGACKACNLPGRKGLCLPVAPIENTCDAGKVCGTLGDCKAPNDAPCDWDSDCASGKCSMPGSTCAGCTFTSDCPSPNTMACIGGACFTKQDNGLPCQGDAGCNSNHCVDGVCCDALCDGLCMACHTAYTGKPNGTCSPVQDGSDPHTECEEPGTSSYCSGVALPTDDSISFCGAL